MTASLPVPRDAFPEQPEVPSERGDGAQIVELPSGARNAEPDATPAPRAPRAPAKPRKPRAPRKPPAAAKPQADPGPPPPLPPEFAAVDIVIPPKPPLPHPSEDIAQPVVEPDVVEEPEVTGPDVVEEPEVTEPDVVEEPEVAAPDVVEEPEVAAPEVMPVAVIDEEDPAIAAVFAEAEAGIEASLDARPAALVLRGVVKTFGDTHAVDGIDLTVPAGTFYGLVGPNGAGKTTTLSMIAGLLRPDRGTISVGGVDAASDPLGAKRLMGVLPDRLRTFDRLTGRQLLYYYGVLRGLPSAVVESRTADLARAFDLTDALGRVVSDYSAGMVKKVMLAGAMIHSPRVLVLDEPFESVDPVSSAVILDILSAYVAHGGTVILSSHGMELVERVCTRVAVLVAGQVLAEGTIDEVRGELTLEQRFIALAGGLSDVEGLEWLHTFSD
ncbi:MAG: ATP-binding cassette domain-containing protein [Microbacterium sp.]